MYDYTEFDAAFVAQRNRQFRAQVERRIAGALTEDEFKPLRLMNGLYLQLHAYMLRVAIPYGTLSAAQMRQLGVAANGPVRMQYLLTSRCKPLRWLRRARRRRSTGRAARQKSGAAKSQMGKTT